MLSNRDHTRLSELDMVTTSMFALSLLYQVRLFEARPSRTREVHLLRRSSYIPTKCAFVPSFRNSSFVISRTARSTIITIAMSLFDTGGSLLCLFRSSTSVGWRYCSICRRTVLAQVRFISCSSLPTYIYIKLDRTATYLEYPSIAQP